MTHSKKLQFVLNELYRINPQRIDLGLERVFKVLDQINNPERKLKNVITICGTTGKASVAFFIKKILREHGYSVSLYQSPHLYNFLTRFLINDHPLDEDEFIKHIIDLDPVKEGLTFFELITIVAFKAFAQHNSDWNIMEFGLGARLDAVNVDYSDLKAQIVTNIGLDHEEFLKNPNSKTESEILKDITFNKLAAIKNNTNVIIAKQKPEVLGYIDHELRGKKINKFIFSEDYHVSLENNQMIYQDEHGLLSLEKPKMHGYFQLENASVAIKTLRSLGLKLDTNKISNAVKNMQLEARIQEIKTGRLRDHCHDTNTLIIDGSHSEEQAKALASYLEEIKGKRSIYLIFSMMKTKNLKNYLKHFSSLVTSIHCYKHRENFYETNEIVECAKELGIPCNVNKNGIEALTQLSLIDGDGCFCCAGSLYSAGSLLEYNQ